MICDVLGTMYMMGRMVLVCVLSSLLLRSWAFGWEKWDGRRGMGTGDCGVEELGFGIVEWRDVYGMVDGC